MGHTVSVVIPTHNRQRTLPRSIASVLAQSAPVHEVIVVDDGSTDDSRQTVDSFASRDARVKYVYQAKSGAASARNRGVAMASGSLIAFQDSDDEWLVDFIRDLLPFHEVPGTVAFSAMKKVSTDGVSQVVFADQIDDVESRLAFESCISTQTVLCDARLFDLFRFDEQLRRLQDWDLWLAMIGTANFVHLPKPLVIQHLQHDGITVSGASFYQALRRVTTKHRRVMARHPVHFARLWCSARLPRRERGRFRG